MVPWKVDFACISPFPFMIVGGIDICFVILMASSMGRQGFFFFFFIAVILIMFYSIRNLVCSPKHRVCGVIEKTVT